MVDQILNSKQAKRLFEENSVYIDGSDIVTVKRAQELFEKDVVDYADKINSKGIKGIDYCGFMGMITAHNIKVISAGREIY